MLRKYIQLLDYLEKALDHTDVSGFEVLEMLDLRSQLAQWEPVMENCEKKKLEILDRRLWQNATELLISIKDVAELEDVRQRSHVLPSHWWWYLDEFVAKREKAVV